jgi:CheY-like chemotaxis protein
LELPRKSLVGRRVLVIEDESLVSMLLEDTLAEIGCEIAALASRFNDAMKKASSLSFDIAILDVNLNAQQTFPIAEVLNERGLPFVFATGYGPANLPSGLQRAPVLQKPFHQHDLERALGAALADRDGEAGATINPGTDC